MCVAEALSIHFFAPIKKFSWRVMAIFQLNHGFFKHNDLLPFGPPVLEKSILIDLA